MAAQAFTQIINARGTFTPLGVSTSSARVASAASQALTRFYLMEEVEHVVDQELSGWSGAEAGAVVNCTAAANTLAVAAVLCGTDLGLIANLPDLQPGVPNRVVIPAAHVVNYGHSILQAVRLSGAIPFVVDTADATALPRALSQGDVACLFLVISRLTDQHACLSIHDAVAAAHAVNKPAIIDAAAQDLRARDIVVGTRADLVLFSGQKYLASPTAGIVVGSRDMVDRVRLQMKGIGRGMKAGKEALLGLLAALQDRAELDIGRWHARQVAKLHRFAQRLDRLGGIEVRIDQDPTQLPFSRATVVLRPPHVDPHGVAHRLKHGLPQIWFFDDRVDHGELCFEFTQLSDSEVDLIAQRLESAISRTSPTRMPALSESR